jgi:hypothetical protein
VALVVIGVIGMASGVQVADATAGATVPLGSTFDLVVNDMLRAPVLLLAFSGYGSMGDLGWLDTAMPPLTAGVVLLVWLGLAWRGLRRWTWPKALAFVAVGGTLLGAPLLMSIQAGVVFGSDIQGRYLVPLIPVLLLVLLVRRRDGGVHALTRTQAVVAAVALWAGQSAALWAIIRRYVTGTGAGWLNLDAGWQWWWANTPLPMVTWAFGTVGFAAVAACLIWVTPARTRLLDDSAGMVDDSGTSSRGHRIAGWRVRASGSIARGDGVTASRHARTRANPTEPTIHTANGEPRPVGHVATPELMTHVGWATSTT